MCVTCGLATDGPNLTVSNLNFDYVKGPRWWTIKNVARCNVESTFMAWTFKSLIVA